MGAHEEIGEASFSDRNPSAGSENTAAMMSRPAPECRQRIGSSAVSSGEDNLTYRKASPGEGR
jgi:hypothetical protein